MKKLMPYFAILFITLTLVFMSCSIGLSPHDPPVKVYDHQVEIRDVFCTYGEPSEFPFKFSLKNLEKEEIEVEYRWTLNDPQADAPVHQGEGSILLPSSDKQEVEISVKKHMDTDPRFYIMYIFIYRNDKQVGYYHGQKSTYDWDYTITPPVRRTKKPAYTHVWIDTFIENTQSGYRVNIDNILFLPPKRTTKLDLDNICVPDDRLLSEILVDNNDPFKTGFHDADNNEELSRGDYFAVRKNVRGKTFKFESRHEPSIHMNNAGYQPETIEEENRDAIRIISVDYKPLDKMTGAIEVIINSENPPEHVDARMYSPGEGGSSSSSTHLEPPVSVEGETYIYTKAIDVTIRDKDDVYLLIFITDGTNEVLYNAGKLP